MTTEYFETSKWHRYAYILQDFLIVSKKKYNNYPFSHYSQHTFQQMQTAVSCNAYACVSPTAQQQAIKVKK